MDEFQKRQLRVASVFLAPGIPLLGGYITFRGLQSYLEELHSGGVSWGTSVLILGILALVVVMCVYASYRFARFAIKGI